MSKTLTIRFQKFDKFNNPIFCCNKENPEEKETFDTLKKWYNKLDDKCFGTFLPVYSTNKFASIRFKSNNKHNHMVERNVYKVVFNMRITERDGKTYVNCYIENLKLEKRGEPADMGKILDLDM